MKSYLRFLTRNKLYTAIMAVGLSVSLAFVIIMSCFVWQNMRVNRMYPDADRIFIVGGFGNILSNFTLGQSIQDNFPEVEKAVTVMNRHGKYSMDGVALEKEGFMGVDPDFFDMFPTEFVYGSKESFNDFSNVIISRSLAEKFGGENVLGKIIKDEFYGGEFRVGAVIEGFEDTIFDNAEIIFNTRAPRFDKNRDEQLGMWSSGMFTFIRVAEGTDITGLTEKLDKMLEDSLEEKYRRNEKHFSLTRLDKLYMADVNEGMSGLKKGNKGLMTAFSIIVVFLLISAIFNYINLNTALTGRRSKEIATRALVGESRSRIFVRCITESIVFIIVCMSAAFLTAHLLLPLVNRLIDSPIPIEMRLTDGFLYMYLLIMVVTTLSCGIIPVLMASNFKPIEIIKGEFRYSRKRIFSKVFIIIQNAIAIVIIAVSLIMSSQIRHMIDMPLNANVEGLYEVRLAENSFEETLSSLPYVGRIGKADGRPGQKYMTIGIPLNEDRSKRGKFNVCNCDSASFSMFDFKIVRNYGLQGNAGVWLTESAFRLLELDENNPVLPQAFSWICGTTDLAGILEDVQMSSAKNLNLDEVGVINLVPRNRQSGLCGDFIVEILDPSDENLMELDRLCREEAIRIRGPHAPDMSGYIPYKIEKEYEGMMNQMKMVIIFMIIAILLSVLGQIAMSTYYATEREKEIGIRKVFGGTVHSESIRNIFEYIGYCLIASVIAIPVAVWVAGRYLETFVYKMDLPIWIFAVAALAVLAVSIASVLWQTLQAAHTNPAEALKKE